MVWNPFTNTWVFSNFDFVNNAAVNLHVKKFLCGQMFLFPLGKYLGVSLLGHMACMCLILYETVPLGHLGDSFG